MKAIITGTSGFIGGRVLKAARSAYGADVVAFSSCAADGKHIIYHDAPDFGLKPADLTLVEGAEVLIHAGAFIPKKGIDANQFSGCNSNITFTEKLLSLPWNNLKKIVYLSTVDVYADVNGPIDETSTTVPASLYGFSKLYCERMVSLNAADRGIASQVLRIGHVFGPGEEKYAKVLPRAIQNIVAGKDVELWGEGSELRSFIYIDDVVSAILQAVELDEEPGVINVVGGKSISIRDLLKKLIEIGGGGTGIIRREFSASTRDLVFDNSKLKRYLLPEERDFVDGLKAEFRHIASLYS
jgi:UDP-glucose 4-epimerase|tara:strand:+ start:15105 stop:15998 length:894 start_codon:yes stop_codon:yes gene_type:complete